MQQTNYLIMWQSRKSGGTYSQLRKTDVGRDRLINTLVWLGVDKKSIQVQPIAKPWEPDGRQYKNRKRVKGRDRANQPEQENSTSLLH